jgi:hypothetical protein
MFTGSQDASVIQWDVVGHRCLRIFRVRAEQALVESAALTRSAGPSWEGGCDDVMSIGWNPIYWSGEADLCVGLLL